MIWLSVLMAIIADAHSNSEYTRFCNQPPTVELYHCQKIEANQCLHNGSGEVYLSQYILHDKGQVQEWKMAHEAIMWEMENHPGKMFLTWREAQRIVIVTARDVYGTAYCGDIEVELRKLEPRRTGITRKIEYPDYEEKE